MTHFTKDEHYTLMTLWSIARSPLILGANLPNTDDFTLSLLTNDEVIAVDQNSTNNKQVSNKDNQVVWMADVPGSADKYVAIFNAAPAPAGGRRRGRRPASAPAVTPQVTVTPAATQPARISVSFTDLGITGPCTVHDLWTHQDLGSSTDSVSATVNSHGAVLFRLHPAN